RTQPETGQDTDLLASRDDPEEQADRTQLITRTRRAIGLLNDDQRQVLTLVDLAEFSYADTAMILNVPVGTVMSRLSRARRRMREILQQQGIGHADVVPLRRPQ
ncbi:MAG: sigma-70 family RNA polymerase sigma factor, partial [Sedimenticolaceae bacterium]